MKTAIDTSVLLDVFGADPAFGEASREALRNAYDSGALLASDVVWAEVRANFASGEAFDAAIDSLGVQFDPTSRDAASLAGQLWRASRRSAKGPEPSRDRVVADFLVGAHAMLQSDALLARDRGHYRDHFKGLRLIDPRK